MSTLGAPQFLGAILPSPLAATTRGNRWDMEIVGPANVCERDVVLVDLSPPMREMLRPIWLCEQAESAIIALNCSGMILEANPSG
ncbi:hypothetical protein GH714_011647 [Hevea brasiliensis]|uniref:Uncharacterized protein n=1 Tax=Hevea brasiliensis TaxID=3981 RepID=A0A6A6KF96_HEVBR|nr:hypothetical protein GH714_011647 [Hevea brasiliensis]